jgi:hypothetical protein
MVTAPMCCHVSRLSANVNGAKLCYLGTSVDGAALGLFSKIFSSGAYLRKSFEKRAKKKDGLAAASKLTKKQDYP